MSNPKMIRCIDPVDGRLIYGKVYQAYEATHLGSHYYVLVDESGHEAGWFKHRFEVVVESSPTHTPPKPEKPFDFDAYNGLSRR